MNYYPISTEHAKELRRQGEEAFKEGYTDEVCPFPINNQYSGARQAWMDGYYGARTEKNVGHILRKPKLRK